MQLGGLKSTIFKIYILVHILVDKRMPRIAGELQLEVGDGWKGWPASAPYDAIHVGAAAARVPDALVDQLAPGGRLVIPVGPEGETQSLAVIDKRKDGTISRHDTMSVMYVPLTTREHQLMSTR